MAVTNTPALSWLLKRLRSDFPEIRFKKGDDFMWSPAPKTIMYRLVNTTEATWSLLHELGHAKLGHNSFNHDIELLAKEAEAWQYAQYTLADLYQLTIDPDYIEQQLDSYRDWLHQRSLCPHCRQTGIQNATQLSQYNCLNCGLEWRVNDARRCALRRYSL